MKADFSTTYREACIADDAREIVSRLWVEAEVGSEAEAKLKSIAAYLWDRFIIEITFCDLVTG